MLYQTQIAANASQSITPHGEIANLAPISQSVLPILTPDVLEVALARASSADIKMALRHKLVAVAWLPSLVLYAAANDEAHAHAEKFGLRIVAHILPSDYRHAVRKILGWRLIQRATLGLAQNLPAFSASRRVTKNQIYFLLSFVAWSLVCLMVLPQGFAFLAFSFVLGVLFLGVVSLRLLTFLPHPKTMQHYRQTYPLSDQELPIYSVLVPVFREIPVLNQLLNALTTLDYPPEKLDIKIILEENDTAMVRAVAALQFPVQFEVIIVPAGKPQTKPRALNYALQFCRGQLLTIFDAEDVPEPNQLRIAAETFAASPSHLACLQARLVFYNANENWLTRQFTIEYATLFSLVLPSLAIDELPIPLGGTSNHFRIDILRKIGGWDPYNVTEDADLGLRLARAGYTTGVIDSQTYEEANKHLGNWLYQRSRWLKGFIQTWLVHMRDPRRLWREMGPAGFMVTQATTFGILMSALFHPFLVGYSLWMFWMIDPAVHGTSTSMLILTGLNTAVFVMGYGLTIWAGKIALRKMGIAGWWWALATMPVYWMLVSLASWMALWQFIWNPFHWNKTTHGLSAHQQSSQGPKSL